MRLSWAAQSHIWRLIDREALMEEHVRGYIQRFQEPEQIKKNRPGAYYPGQENFGSRKAGTVAGGRRKAIMSKKAPRRVRQEREQTARGDLTALRARLTGAYSVFNNTTDPELLEASILEIRSLESKYAHALRALKALL